MPSPSSPNVPQQPHPAGPATPAPHDADGAVTRAPAPHEDTGEHQAGEPQFQAQSASAPVAPRRAWHLITRAPQPAPAGAPHLMARPPNLLLVHGAGHAAWCWEKLQARCAYWGIRTHAITLRGHNGHPRGRALASARLDDYVADVAQAAAEVSEPFVVAGHSLGGIVIQRYLSWLAAGRTLPRPDGAILLATATPTDLLRGWKPSRLLDLYGVWGLLTLLTWTLVGTQPIEMCPTPAHTRRLFFTPATPQADVLACYLRLHGERPALWRDVRRFAHEWRAPETRGQPLLVLGGALGACVAPEHIKRLAQHYGATVHLFADMGHDLMLDTGWEAVADAIADWLRALPPPPSQSIAPTPHGGNRVDAGASGTDALAHLAAPVGPLVPLRPLWDGEPGQPPMPGRVASATAGSWRPARDRLSSRPPRRDQDAKRHHQPSW